jgi:hypothetical protein
MAILIRVGISKSLLYQNFSQSDNNSDKLSLWGGIKKASCKLEPPIQF